MYKAFVLALGSIQRVTPWKKIENKQIHKQTKTVRAVIKTSTKTDHKTLQADNSTDIHRNRQQITH